MLVVAIKICHLFHVIAIIFKRFNLFHHFCKKVVCNSLIQARRSNFVIDGIKNLFWVVAMGLVYALYGFYALWRSLQKATMHPDDKTDFRVVPPLPASTPETLSMDARTEEATDDSKLQEPA